MNLVHARSTHCQSATAPTVFVVDNDVAVRESVADLVRFTGWQTVMASSAEEFLARPRVCLPCCLLVEMHLPGVSGLDLQRLVADRTEMSVIFMSGNADIPTTVRAMKAGAFEFLTKPLARDMVLQAIRHAIERSHAALPRLHHRQTLQARYELLSRRERDVLKLVVCGRLNKQVGSELGISEITVKAHRGSIMRKMRATSLAELVTLAASVSVGPDRYFEAIAS
jgi:FixJ family two-component response regulator